MKNRLSQDPAGGDAAPWSVTPLSWWPAHLPASILRSLAKSWPWSLIAYLVWFGNAWILSYFFNEFTVNLAPIVMAITPGLLLLIVLTALAHDTQVQTDPHQAQSMSG